MGGEGSLSEQQPQQQQQQQQQPQQQQQQQQQQQLLLQPEPQPSGLNQFLHAMIKQLHAISTSQTSTQSPQPSIAGVTDRFAGAIPPPPLTFPPPPHPPSLLFLCFYALTYRYQPLCFLLS